MNNKFESELVRFWNVFTELKTYVYYTAMYACRLERHERYCNFITIAFYSISLLGWFVAAHFYILWGILLLLAIVINLAKFSGFLQYGKNGLRMELLCNFLEKLFLDMDEKLSNIKCDTKKYACDDIAKIRMAFSRREKELIDLVLGSSLHWKKNLMSDAEKETKTFFDQHYA